MKSFVSNNHFELTTKDTILNISQKANAAKIEGKDIINATIGMLFDEQGRLVDFPIVDEIISKSNDELNRKYGGVAGRPTFKEAIQKWLFSNIDLHNKFVGVIPTIGATGALCLSMRNYVDKGQYVLVPNIRWSNYDNVAQQMGLDFRTYNLFKNGSLDIDSIKESALASLKLFGRCYLIINDPCQNPTGYSMSYDEWKELLSFLKANEKLGPVILMDDIAYMNYSEFEYDQIIALMEQFVSDNLMIQFAFSAAKTLSIYGLRGGALVALSNNNEEIKMFEISTKATARSIWSMPNNIANNVIEKCFIDDANRLQIRKQLAEYTKMLKDRANLYFKECVKYGLKNKPYRNGFFVLLECKNNELLCDELCNRDVFAVPLSGGLRISLASITLKRIPEMVKIISEALNREV